MNIYSVMCSAPVTFAASGQV